MAVSRIAPRTDGPFTGFSRADKSASMAPQEPNLSSRRVLIENGMERRDDLGFLDRGRTPRVVEIAGLSGFPAAWIAAPPWLGKTTVARRLHDWLRACPT